ncbi:MAG: orotate phosphoribosyltransferase [Prevotellaceae bacterium]|jgi:orotate phosphoribosyltransferase|nr:orotate phosphoribosyltransferase [Prevotellaceae bacterium]
MNTAKIAQSLLQIKAIKLNPANPFSWASGWKSPVYCDNRKALAYPAVRRQIAEAFSRLVKCKYPDVEVVAGVATGAIAYGLLVAEQLNLPFVYVRAMPKEHGLGNQIEGELQPNKKVVVVEDSVSTGGSSLSALAALRDAGAKVLGMVAIFTYGFEAARKNFEAAKCELAALSGYNELIEEAVASGYVKPEEAAVLQKWREAPDKWGV